MFDDDEEDESNEAAMAIKGPGIPDYNETQPHHWLETRLNWRKGDLNKDGVVPSPRIFSRWSCDDVDVPSVDHPGRNGALRVSK